MTSAIGERSLGWFETEKVCDEPDIAALVAGYSALLYRVAFSILRRPAEAEDVVQETFLRVLQHKEKLATVDEPRTWLVRIAWNLALNRRQRIQPEQMDEVVTAALGSRDRPADEVLAQARTLADVLAVMERLPRREREVLLLSAVEELSTAEVAAVLGMSASGVRSLLFRAREHVRERLGHRHAKPMERKGGQ